MSQTRLGLKGIIEDRPLAPGEGLGCISFETALMRHVEPLPEDFDELGHVNNVVYLKWVQEMAVTHWHLISPQAQIESEVWVALKHTIEYRDAIEPGQIAEIRTWLGSFKGARFNRHVDIRKPGARRFSAYAVTEWCRLSAETRRPMRIDDATLDLFRVRGLV